MRIAVAGSTGVLGRSLLPALRERGHEVLGISRSASGDDSAAADVHDRDAVVATVSAWRPDVIVHAATAIPDDVDPRRAVEQFEPTNRLRTEGTANLLAAAEAAGGARLVAESVAFMARPGAGLASEDVPLRDEPGDVMERIAAPLGELERMTVEAGGTVLRYGLFYGSGTAYAADGSIGARVGRGRIPILTRSGEPGRSSFIEVSDAARATVAAIEREATGIFHIVDDEPAPAAEWISGLAEALGATPPRRLPAWVARPMVGAYGIEFMCGLRGASNARAKAELGWAPSFASWREGFRDA